MSEQTIKLKPLSEIGAGIAKVDENSVDIEVHGINGGMKAWLIGGESQPVGNLVDGRLHKEIDTTKNNGILITQCGRQMLIGAYSEEIPEENSVQDVTDTQELPPFEGYGFNWKKVSGKSFETNNLLMKYILSNKAVYESFKKHRHYFLGNGNGCCALALPCGEDEENPLRFLGKMNKRVGKYIIVCINEKAGKLYIP